MRPAIITQKGYVVPLKKDSWITKSSWIVSIRKGVREEYGSQGRCIAGHLESHVEES